MTQSNNFSRKVQDCMGTMHTPADALWGAQTQRAVENFPVSGIPFPRAFIRALGLIKLAAAKANQSLNLLDTNRAEAIGRAAQQVVDGSVDNHFPLDIFQTGSGTSTNMNANEVIATLANEPVASQADSAPKIHPNDHVNRGQSSNDVIPTAMHIAAAETIQDRLLPVMRQCRLAFERKAGEFESIVKIGRTHLQDAVPITLGQEFSGYAAMIAQSHETITALMPQLCQLALGGTAVGTGLNTHQAFATRAIQTINQHSSVDFCETRNHFAAQAGQAPAVTISGALKNYAVTLMKIANDIRLLGSGPRCGIGELELTPVQPGSSIMPGKVNPVMAESVCQVAAQVIGNDAVIAVAGASGNFELNVMLPVITHNLLQSITLLANVTELFTTRCIDTIEANRQRCNELVEQSLALITALVPHLGYDKAAALAHKAWHERTTIREQLQKEDLFPENQLNQLLNPNDMLRPFE